MPKVPEVHPEAASLTPGGEGVEILRWNFRGWVEIFGEIRAVISGLCDGLGKVYQRSGAIGREPYSGRDTPTPRCRTGWRLSVPVIRL